MADYDRALDDAMRLIEDPQTRRVFEFFLKIGGASALKASYDLQLEPDKLDPLLQKLLDAGLVQPVTTAASAFSRSYIPTAIGFRVKRYLTGPQPRQFKI